MAAPLGLFSLGFLALPFLTSLMIRNMRFQKGRKKGGKETINRPIGSESLSK